ncbi:hypothetical protein SmJEL517_g04418 [Synchytrium microbalum]|uniref:Uncharacterized protein n=1 Tax=Synchytrium microbalum TaxID=1806994 RepID=A0A507C4H3_9FUNG|nr:uncharacterized protein SmJEL517_g04418 [Synchytrium microbalum]TPX32433.1 hypothetical protein SmJEL517_g04418 [Synchytrium microbalum]
MRPRLRGESRLILIGTISRIHYTLSPCKGRPLSTSQGQTTDENKKTILEVRQYTKRGRVSEYTSFQPSSPANSNASNGSSRTTAWHQQPSSSSTSPKHYTRALDEKFQLAFLPKNYHSSVTADYIPYSIYQFLHSVTGTITGTLSTQALLQALGMGAATSIGLAATTNWIIKDGFGLLGGVIYAAVVSNKFDAQPKRYRFYSALALQAATILELVTPMVPHLFLPLASFSNIAKNVAWLASSATRAAMHRGFTKEDNLGDVTAKAGVQATAAGLVGTALGVGVSWVVGTQPWMLGLAFFPLCVANLGFAYMANVCVVTRSLNVTRAELALRPLIVDLVATTPSMTDTQQSSDTATTTTYQTISTHNGDDDDCIITQKTPTPDVVGRQEWFLMKQPSEFSIPLIIEAPLSKYLPRLTETEADAFVHGRYVPSGCQYRILVVNKKNKGRRVYLWLLEDAKTKDVVAAIYHSCILRVVLEKHSSSATSDVDTIQAMEQANELAQRTFEPTFTGLAQKGWDVMNVHIEDNDMRLELISGQLAKRKMRDANNEE